MRNSENVLNSLAGHSQDLSYKFERLYRLLFNENLFAEAINGCPEIQATAQKELTDRQ